MYVVALRSLSGVKAIQDQTGRKAFEDILAGNQVLERSMLEANSDCGSILDSNGFMLFSIRTYEEDPDKHLTEYHQDVNQRASRYLQR